MHKRPLNPRFTQAVLDGRKTTTIRDHPWPVWKEVMLYNWAGAAYRSKQIDVAPVLVESETLIIISNVDGIMCYLPDNIDGTPLHVTEGFAELRDMDEWFERLVKPGQQTRKHLMRFRLLPRD